MTPVVLHSDVPPAAGVPAPVRRLRRAAYGLGLVFALAFSYDLARIPVQVSDSLGDILEAQSQTSAAGAFMSMLESRIFLRPLKAAQIRLVSDVSRGEYTLAYRAVHMALLVLTVVAFVSVMRVETSADFMAAALALTVFFGIHTFANVLKEAYPINHFLEIALFALVALRLAQGPPGWWRDVAAVALFTAAALIVESGLLVWVVVAAAYVSGYRGITWRGLVVVTMLLVAYLYVRNSVFTVAMPGVDERSSGVWLNVLQPDELRAMFGDRPWLFFGYNTVSALLTVLFAEPRGGWWVATRAYLDGALLPWMWVAVVTSTLTTLVVAAGAVSAWRNRSRGDVMDRIYIVAAAVIAANCVLTYSYLKDEILVAAGVFYALMVYLAVRRLIGSVSATTSPVAVMVLGVALLAASCGWAVRTTGLHYGLRSAAFKTRNDWVAVPERWMATPAWRAVSERLRRDALDQRIVAPRFEPRWETQWFEE